MSKLSKNLKKNINLKNLIFQKQIELNNMLKKIKRNKINKIQKNITIKQFKVKSIKTFKKIWKILNKNNLIAIMVIQMKSNLKH